MKEDTRKRGSRRPPLVAPPDVMDAIEAGQYLRLHYMTIQRMARRGDLPGRKVAGQWRFLRTEIDAYLRGQWNPPEGD